MKTEPITRPDRLLTMGTLRYIFSIDPAFIPDIGWEEAFMKFSQMGWLVVDSRDIVVSMGTLFPPENIMHHYK